MKQLLKRLLPERFILFYHYLQAKKAARNYNFPSEELIVIGVTGTKGKTSVANFIWATLTAGGKKVGIISTANIRIGEKEEKNEFHMTMPGRDAIQKLLRRMVDEECTHAVVETTSEGLKQFRHIGVNYDYAIFTNLSPEHLPSHGGSFEKYKEQKGVLFKTLGKLKKKSLAGKTIPKISIINTDSENASYFSNFPADKKLTFSIENPAEFQAKKIKSTDTGMSFSVKNKNYEISLPGRFNIYNALPAIALAFEEGISNDDIKTGLESLTVIPGRMEEIKAGQSFTVFVDYAHEGESMRQALETVREKTSEADRVIVLLGAEGGGRDKSKRPIMGELAAKLSDVVVISNVDPYDDDPLEIIEDIAKSVEDHGKVRDKNLFLIPDRRLGIKKALSSARPGDVVIITGKGAEQSMIIAGKSISWDDREVVREELNRI